MIDGFKIGYYYKFIGNKGHYHYYWGDDMELILDRKWYKCIKTNYNNYAQFECMENCHYWFYEDFIESKCNPYVKKLLKEIQ